MCIEFQLHLSSKKEEETIETKRSFLNWIDQFEQVKLPKNMKKEAEFSA